MPALITRAFAVSAYEDQATWLQVSPSASDWTDLKQDARACAATGELNLRITWNPGRKYWLEGTSEALSQFDSISQRAASRLGYRGPHHVVCLLERLLERVCLSSYAPPDELFTETESDLAESPTIGDGPVFISEDLIISWQQGPPSTGSWTIESIFSAAATLFMKYQALREAAAASSSNSETESPAAEPLPTIDDVEAALRRHDIRAAMKLRVRIEKSRGRKASAAKFYRAAGVDRSEYYRVCNGKNPPGSAPHTRIVNELRNGI